jgi:hypothetical protein
VSATATDSTASVSLPPRLGGPLGPGLQTGPGNSALRQAGEIHLRGLRPILARNRTRFEPVRTAGLAALPADGAVVPQVGGSPIAANDGKVYVKRRGGRR